MRLRNTIKMILANFSVAYKVLIFKLAVVLVLGVIGYFAIAGNFNSILQESQLRALITSFGMVINAIFMTHGSHVEDLDKARGEFTADLGYFKDYMTGNFGSVIGLLLIVLLFVWLALFFNKFANFAVCEVVNDHMQTLADRSFFVSLFKNFNKAVLFSLIEIGIDFLFFILSTSLALLIFVFTYEGISVLSVFFGILIFVCAFSLKSAFLSDFMPGIIVDGKSVGKAFRDSVVIKRKEFAKLFSNYFTIYILLMFINVAFAICTFFTGLIITVPLSVLMTVGFQCINYFTLTGKKYYISSDEIITPKGAKEDLSLVDAVDE